MLPRFPIRGEASQGVGPGGRSPELGATIGLPRRPGLVQEARLVDRTGRTQGRSETRGETPEAVPRAGGATGGNRTRDENTGHLGTRCRPRRQPHGAGCG